MQFQARVRATVLLTFDADVPALEFEQAPPNPDDDDVKPTSKKPGQRAVNEDVVLEARAGVAVSAEQQARDAFGKFTVVDVTVEEVCEQ